MSDEKILIDKSIMERIAEDVETVLSVFIQQTASKSIDAEAALLETNAPDFLMRKPTPKELYEAFEAIHDASNLTIKYILNEDEREDTDR